MKNNNCDKLSEYIGDCQVANIKAACMDCDKYIDITVTRISDKELSIEGGVIAYHESVEGFMTKCDECFKKQPLFVGDTDVYSRVVGYMRPVSGWNDAKKEEFSMRKTLKQPA